MYERSLKSKYAGSKSAAKVKVKPANMFLATAQAISSKQTNILLLRFVPLSALNDTYSHLRMYLIISFLSKV